MRPIQSRRKFVCLLFALGIIFSISCSLSSTVDRFWQALPEIGSDRPVANQPEMFEGTYYCQENHGQTFPSSQELPSQPGEMESLVSEDLKFAFQVEPVDDRQGVLADYTLQYQCNAHIREPLLFYFNGRISEIENVDAFLTQSTSKTAGSIDQDGWFSGSWMEHRHFEIPGRHKITDSETTWHYIGFLDFSVEQPQVLLCAGNEPLDRLADQVSGASSFADFCADRNFFICTRK